VPIRRSAYRSIGVALLAALPWLAHPAWGAALRGVTDDSGREIQVPAAPLRIVSLAGATEMLFTAGAGGGSIATVEYSDEPAAARRVPRIGTLRRSTWNAWSRCPDVVVLWAAGGNRAAREIVSLHIPIYARWRAAPYPPAVRRLGRSPAPPPSRIARRSGCRRGSRRKRHLRRAHRQAPGVLLQVWNRPIYTVGGRHLMSDALELCSSATCSPTCPRPARWSTPKR
jgi:iron complex transport system substrate-binding protein